MPTYLWECESCGEQFETKGSYKYLENNIPICPKCWKENVHRIYTAIPTIFKGKGFYKTDERQEESG